MSKSKFSLRRLFSNTKFLIAFSLVLAFIFWVVVALEYAPIVDNVIEDVPVTIDMKNSVPDKFGLQIFGQKDFTVDVSVRGSRYIVGGDLLNANDFEVTAQTAYVNSAGSHTLQLKVTAKDPESSFEIIGLSSDYIEVFFDKPAEKQISVEPRIITKLTALTDNGYSFDENDLILPVKTVKITGPETQVDPVKKAYADIEIEKKLNQSETVDAVVSLDNGMDEKPKYVSVNGAEEYKIPVTIPVYKIVDSSELTVDFQNVPSEYVNNPVSYTCIPEKMNVLVLQNGDRIDSVLSVGSIDFSELNTSGNVFSFKTQDIKNVKVTDGTKEISVSVDVGNVSQKSFKLDKSVINFAGNDSKGFAYNEAAFENVKVIGPAETLEAITLDDFTVTIDPSSLKDGQKSGIVTASVTLKNKDDCWIYGKYDVILTK